MPGRGARKILIVRLSSLGDIILTFPLLKKLRRNLPESKIDFLTKPEFREAVELAGITDSIITADRGIGELRSLIRQKSYDTVLDVQGSRKSIYLTAFNGKSVKRLRKGRFKKFLLVNGRIDLFDEIVPVYRRYVNTASELLPSGDTGFETLELHTSPVPVPSGPYIVIAPSSRHFTKTYPAELFSGFMNTAVNTTAVLVGSGSAADMEVCGKIENTTANVTNMCGKLSVRELAYVIQNSAIVITNDSAVLHLSEALNKQTTAIYGGTVKQLGFFPQLETTRVLERNEVSCRPCSHIGLPECPALGFDCMRKIILSRENTGLNSLKTS